MKGIIGHTTKAFYSLLFLAGFQFAMGQEQVRFYHFTSKDGLPGEPIHNIAQDGLGFIWFQYYGGLVRFDGYNFKIYQHDPSDEGSLPSGSLGIMYSDTKGHVWVETPCGDCGKYELTEYDQKRDAFVRHRMDLGGYSPSKVHIDHFTSSVWMAMPAGQGVYRYNPETHETEHYINVHPDSLVQHERNTVRYMKDFGSYILIATRMGLWRVDKNSGEFSRPPVNPRDTALLYHVGIIRILEIPSTGGYWLTSYRRMIRIDKNFTVVQEIAMPEEEERKIQNGFGWARTDVDYEGNVWIGTDNGVYLFDTTGSSFLNLKSIAHDPGSLRSNIVKDVLTDRDNNIWFATESGISYVKKQSLPLHNITIEGGGIGAAAIYRSKEDEYLILSRNSQKSVWQVKMDQRVFDIVRIPIQAGRLLVEKQERFLPPLGSDVKTFWQGRKTLWVATNDIGVLGYPINQTTGLPQATPFRIENIPGNSNSLSSNVTICAWEDSDESLWVGTHGDGLNKLSVDSSGGVRSVTVFKNDSLNIHSLSNNIVYSVYPSNQKSLWAMTDSGVDLFEIANSNPDQYNITRVFRGLLPNDLYETSNGTVYIGTVKGMYSSVETKMEYLSILGLKSYTVNDISEDLLGRLWISNDQGILCYDPKEKVSTLFNEGDGLLYGQMYDPGTAIRHRDMIFSFNRDGVSWFNPLDFRIDRQEVFPVLTKLVVNNEEAITNESHEYDKFVSTSHVTMLDQLALDYLHNNFSLEFSAMEMTAPEKNRYRHMLAGFDRDWIETDHRNRTATYTNLPAGTYTFRVKGSNHHGIWSDKERTLTVVILPPPWRSWWAYTGYSLMVVGLLFGARRMILQRERLKSSLKLEQVEREKEHFELEKAKEVDRVKTSFFTNVSHEFRTPLTLIKGPVQNILERYRDDPKLQEQMKLVQRNSDLLLKLINQLLDLAKLESGTLKVEKSEGEVNGFIRAVASSFESFARQKNIALAVEIRSVSSPALFDKDKLETILINLINNAIKFTPSAGIVKVIAEVVASQHPGPSAQNLSIRVTDTGIGIPPDQQNKIFERFHQVSEAHKEVGTGIGLSLVKELVTLMGGEISVKSEPGEGSEFTVTIPVEPTSSDKLQAVSHGEVEAEPTQIHFERPTSIQHPVTSSNGIEDATPSKPQVLVVEDNVDLRAFIIDSLGSEFQFHQAENGKQGLAIATEQIPDMIISDVMMPEMDGMEMTRRIKEDIKTSHIPLILLTAKSGEDSKLEGLSKGADDYLTKPFNKQELLLKVRNGTARMQKIREKLKMEVLSGAPSVEVMSADEQFLNKVKETIIDRMSDEQLSVESLADDIGMSRVQLYRKVSALTGMAVNELIRKLRLQRAGQLLQQQWGPVSQVAYEVGFSNLSYFSKVFKEEFGVLPSEYEKV